MKKKTLRIILIFVIALIVVLIIGSIGFFISRKINMDRYLKSYNISDFGDDIYEIYLKPTAEDSKIAESVLDEVDRAMRFVGSKEENKQKFGRYLDIYCTELSYLELCGVGDISQIEFDITINHITSKFEGNKGYVWFEYTQLLRHHEKALRGSSALVRLEVEKNTKGEWEIISLIEPA